VAPKITSGIEIARPRTSSTAALGRRRDRDDIVQAHDEVGDQDRLDRRHQVLVRLDVGVVVLGNEELDADPEEQQAADQLEPGQREQRHGEQREDDSQDDRRARAPENRQLLLSRRQRARGEGDDHRVVARQDDVDADDLRQAEPESLRQQFFEHALF